MQTQTYRGLQSWAKVGPAENITTRNIEDPTVIPCQAYWKSVKGETRLKLRSEVNNIRDN